MSATLRSILLGTSGLTALLVVACVLVLVRGTRELQGEDSLRLLRAFRAAIALQLLHAVEEAATGFHERFPEALGMAPWPLSFFLAFNATWIAIWLLASLHVCNGSRLATIPAWFLALAALANGVVHALLAWNAGGYFPGLWTSLPVAVAGGLLACGLWRAQASPRRVQPELSAREPTGDSG